MSDDATGAAGSLRGTSSAGAEPLTFERWYAKHGQPYEAAVIAGGGTPWPLDPEKRAEITARLGLPEDADPMELRRALWARRYERTNQA